MTKQHKLGWLKFRDAFDVFRVATALDFAVAVTGKRHAFDLTRRSVNLLVSYEACRDKVGGFGALLRVKTMYDGAVLALDVAFALSDWKTNKIHQSIIDGTMSVRHVEAFEKIRAHKDALLKQGIVLPTSREIALDAIEHDFLGPSPHLPTSVEEFKKSDRLRLGTELVIHRPPEQAILDLVTTAFKATAFRGRFTSKPGDVPMAALLSDLNELIWKSFRPLISQYSDAIFVTISPEADFNVYVTDVDSFHVIVISVGMQRFVNRSANLYISSLSPDSILKHFWFGDGRDRSKNLTTALSAMTEAARTGEDAATAAPIMVRLKSAAQDYKSLIEWAILAFIILHEVAHIHSTGGDPSNQRLLHAEQSADEWAARALARWMRTSNWDSDILYAARCANQEVGHDLFSSRTFPSDTGEAAILAGLIVLAILDAGTSKLSADLAKRARHLEQLAANDDCNLTHVLTNPLLRELRGLASGSRTAP
jgi:hypothetical protein